MAWATVARGRAAAPPAAAAAPRAAARRPRTVTAKAGAAGGRQGEEAPLFGGDNADEGGEAEAIVSPEVLNAELDGMLGMEDEPMPEEAAAAAQALVEQSYNEAVAEVTESVAEIGADAAFDEAIMDAFKARFSLRAANAADCVFARPLARSPEPHTRAMRLPARSDGACCVALCETRDAK